MTNMNDRDGSTNYTTLDLDKRDLLVHTHSCPLITNNGVPLTNKNMSLEQCITRLKEQARCTTNCSFLKSLKK